MEFGREVPEENNWQEPDYVIPSAEDIADGSITDEYDSEEGLLIGGYLIDLSKYFGEAPNVSAIDLGAVIDANPELDQDRLLAEYVASLDGNTLVVLEGDDASVEDKPQETKE